MRFHDVLEEVFGTSERIKVLRVLMRYRKEFTSRELSGYCGVSVRGIIDILSLFERYGLVKSRRVGKSILWKVDENNYLTKSLILPSFEVERNLVDHLKQRISTIVRRFPVQNAVIYGSIARGDERPDSDIDLLLIVKKKGKWVEELQDKLRREILGLFGNLLSILICTQNEYKKMSRELKKEIERGIVAFGD
ncbi:MAG: nucleotidyltransferase domain-containing protein [Candidatus Hadarchaeaceae archaeon]